ncbi:MAG: hypothetical protein IPN94_04955 [Sphingobacteriales bacterium]|nr:hypothetical protein [Sphingobacteriales bacterium]
MEKKEKIPLLYLIGAAYFVVMMLLLVGSMVVGIYDRYYPDAVYCTCSKVTRFSRGPTGKRFLHYNTIDPISHKISEYTYTSNTVFSRDAKIGDCFLTEEGYGFINFIGDFHTLPATFEGCDGFIVKKGYCKDVYPQYFKNTQ